MTVLDKSVPFIRVLMVMPRKTVRKEIPLNTKYQYVEFDDTLKEAWCKLQLEVGLFDSLAQAKEKWESMLKEDRAFFVQNFLFVADQQGELVASAGLWLIPPILGTKIIAVGKCFPNTIESCPAPLFICLYARCFSSQCRSITRITFGSLCTECSQSFSRSWV